MSQQQTPTLRVHLVKPHRHAGRDYPVGAPLTLPESKASWLIGLGVASVDAPGTADNSPTAEASQTEA